MPPLKNPKHELFAQAVATGQSAADAARQAGYSESVALQQTARLSGNVGIQSRIVELQSEIAAKATWDAAKVLQRLGEQADADLLDLQDEQGQFKPMAQWPLHWRQMIQGVEIEQKSVRSSDGVQAGESRGWDKTGDRILKIKFIDRLKNLELLGRHKAVDAFVQQKNEDHIHLHLHAELNNRIAAGRQRARERHRDIPATVVG